MKLLGFFCRSHKKSTQRQAANAAASAAELEKRQKGRRRGWKVGIVFAVVVACLKFLYLILKVENMDEKEAPPYTTAGNKKLARFWHRIKA